MVLTGFLLQDNLANITYFDETFLLANTSMKIILEIFFFDF